MENNNQNNVNNTTTEKKGLKVRFNEFKAGHPKTCKLVKRLALAVVVAGAFVAGTKQGSGSSYDESDSSDSASAADETTTE